MYLGLGDGGKGWWFGAGAGFTVAHFWWAGRAFGCLEGMGGVLGKGEPREAMREWVRINLVRTLVVDLVGWGCYLVGVL